MRKRAFIIGIIFSAFIAMLDPYLMMRGLNATFCFEYWTPAAIFVLMILVFLSALHRKLELSSSELLLIFVMTSTASVLPSMGFMSSFIPIVTGFKYFATPGNQWAEFIIERTRPILMVQDNTAIAHFYEGLPPGQSIPYLAWLSPMSFMLAFMLIFSFLSICLMVLFRKQWIEKERLVYPLTILPLEMVKKQEGKGRLPTLFKDKLFWFAFVLAFLFYLSNWLSRKATGSPFLSLSGNMNFFRRSIAFSLNPHFSILGLAYLVPRSVSLSLWFFHVLFTIQSGILSVSGFKLPGMNDPYGGRSIVTTFEGAGGMLTLVVALFWRARKHLTDCVKKAFGSKCDIDDSQEMLSYRTSVFGFLISFLAMVGIMRYLGMPWFTSFVFMIFVIMVFVGLSRIVCQAGLPATRAQCIPPVYASYLLPPNIVTPQGYLVMGLQYSWAADIRSSVMASTGHALKIREETTITPRLLFVGIISAVIVSYIFSAWIHIHSGYKFGALNASTGGSGPWFFGGAMSRLVSNLVIPNMQNPITKDIIVSRYIFTAIGSFVMGLLMLLHSKFLWWPLHYIGFPIAETLPLRSYWFAIFLAWLIKGLILRFGGHNVYKRSVSFFLGLILSNTVWTIVEAVLTLINKTKI
ncbi:OPT/YSL family transporter [bacterium]|nr:OPT/YSL family transporter [bacterium]